MNQPNLYRRSNILPRYDAEHIFKEFSKVFQWRTDGHDSLLDVGCGPGDVLMDFIYPLMPKNFEKIVGTDISSRMIEYAREYYQDYKRCEFEVLDIGTDKTLPLHLLDKFDHVTSCYCLHWVQNQRQALKNIYNLIRPKGGDCLLVYLVSIPNDDVYIELSKSPKWSSVMEDVNKFITPFYYATDPQKMLENFMKECGFSEIQVEVRNKLYIYKDIDLYTDFMSSVCPFLQRLPSKRHSEFMMDFVKVVKNMNLWRDYESKVEISWPYKLMVVYARKM